MCLQTLPIEEAHGLVWLWHGEGRPDKPVPWFDDVRSDSPTSSSGAMVFPVHYSRIVESNFDVYHFPFVHRSIDPGLGAEVADLVVKAEDGVIRTKGAIVNAKGRATPFRVDFLPPNVQRLQLTEHVVGVIVSTPIDEENTWVWARYDQTFFPWPFVGRWISAALLMLEWTVVQKLQDIPVLRELDPPKAEPGACVWVEADAGAARYVQWRARQLRRVRAETPLRQVGT
jgi:phenylpropionate dioxygenase-like ring-hydroxylating dioxygenase large terminal subunit